LYSWVLQGASLLLELRERPVHGDWWVDRMLWLFTLATAVAAPPRLVQVDGGYMHTCGIDDDGRIHCWGQDDHRAVSGAPRGKGFVEVRAGLYRSCALDSKRMVVCWGREPDGDEVTHMPDNPGPQQHVDTVDDATCAIDAKGRVRCWGTGPVAQGAPEEPDLVAMSIGGNHACVLREDGTLYCWGHGSGTDHDPPFQAVPPPWPVVQVAVGGGYHTCGLRRDGSVGCWGGDGSGDGGNVYAGHIRAPPGTFVQVTTGHDHSCGRRLDGTVTCWGELGDPEDNGGFIDLTSGFFHACGLRRNTVVCWGNDQWGQVSTTPK